MTDNESKKVITATASPKKETVITPPTQSQPTICEEKNFQNPTKIDDIFQWLEHYKVIKGQTSTHTLMTGGLFNIPDSNLPMLFDLLANTTRPISLTEKHPLCKSSMVIDFDFRLKEKPTTRIFDDNLIKEIVQLYHKHMINMGIDGEYLKTYVLTRKDGYLDKSLYKDGFHLQLPYVTIDYESQYELRKRVITDLTTMTNFPKTLNSLEDVVDISVIERNNWLLLGCQKPIIGSYPTVYREPYVIHRIYTNVNGTTTKYSLKNHTLSNYESISLLSIRNIGGKQIIKTNYESVTPTPTVSPTLISSPALISLPTLISSDQTKEPKLLEEPIPTDLMRDLLSCLDDRWCEQYNLWCGVGWVLHNIAQDKDPMLKIFIEWSKQSSKYREGCCEQLFATARKTGKILGLGSLVDWIKEDHKEGHEEVLDRLNNLNLLSILITKTFTGCSEPIANLVKKLYGTQYVCTSIKYNKWYHFSKTKHRWVEIDKAHDLFSDLGQKLEKYYRPYIKNCDEQEKELTAQLTEVKEKISKIRQEVRKIKKRQPCDAREKEIQTQTEELDQLLISKSTLSDNLKQANKQAKMVRSVSEIVSDMGGKEKQMKECAMKFYRSDFEEQFDANPYLIGFENGVYDLTTGKLRDGIPEDMITMSTNINCIEFSEDDENIINIYEFLSQVFPDDSLRDYVVILLASLLEGKNPNEKFHIWTGVGGNGKSKLLELFEKSFGQYAAKIPVTVITQKNKATSSSATPEVSCLKGKRTISTQEPDDAGGNFNTGTIKEWTGGDRITCRPLYGEQFMFKPQFKMIFCCNKLPKLPPDDEGTWRRISVVHFSSKFVDNPDPHNINEFKKDVQLSEKISGWAEAFMYILLQHYKVYQQTGLKEPEQVKSATLHYQQNTDTVGIFIENNMEKDSTQNAYVSLVNIWRAFQSSDEYDKNINKNSFKALLIKKLGVECPNRVSVGGKWRSSPFIGYKLIVHNEDEDEDEDEDNNI